MVVGRGGQHKKKNSDTRREKKTRKNNRSIGTLIGMMLLLLLLLLGKTYEFFSMAKIKIRTTIRRLWLFADGGRDVEVTGDRSGWAQDHAIPIVCRSARVWYLKLKWNENKWNRFLVIQQSKVWVVGVCGEDHNWFLVIHHPQQFVQFVGNPSLCRKC